VVTWDSARVLPACLEALAAQTLAPERVVVVDNASMDDSAGIARRFGCEVIANRANLGFCRASNLGWARARGGAALFLNPDVVLEAGYLEAATAPLQASPRVGLVAGKLLRFDRVTLDSTGQFLGRSRRTIDRGYGQRDQGQFEVGGPVFSVCGAAALYRREALEDIAPDGEVFDADFFAFHEDLDLGWRAQRHGWSGCYVPAARGYHLRGGSNEELRRAAVPRARLRTLPDPVLRHAVKNRYLAMIKNDTLPAIARDLPFILGRELLLWSYLGLCRPRVAWGVVTDGASRAGAWEKRRRERGAK
jgi:GT2 family glycosyltransferase